MKPERPNLDKLFFCEPNDEPIKAANYIHYLEARNKALEAALSASESEVERLSPIAVQTVIRGSEF